MLETLEQLSISQWIATADWGYPLLLSIHSMGMAIVVGLLVMLDLRVLGAARALPFTALARLMPLAWGGFLLNLVSGVLLFMSAAPRLAVNWPFLCKLGAIVIGGAVSFYLWRSILADMHDNHPQPRDAMAGSTATAGGSLMITSARTKRLAVLSLVVWFSAILFGRLIAYVLDAALLGETA